MVRKSILLVLALCGIARADTGFKNTIYVTETDNSPKCQAGQIKVSPGSLTCSGQTATITTGGGGSPTPGSTSYVNINPAATQAGGFSTSTGTVVGDFKVSGKVITSSPTWAVGPVLTAARAHAQPLKLRTGIELFIGGSPNSTDAGGISTTVQMFDPSTNLLTSTGSLVTARGDGSTSIVMCDGNVLTCGGINGGNTAAIANCEIRGTASGVYVATTSWNLARVGRGMAVLPNCDILAAGGSDPVAGVNYSSAAEVLHNGVWSSTSSMPSTQAFPSVATLANGAVVFSGGDVNDSTVGSTSTYFYQGTWTTIPGFVGLSTSFNGANEAVDSRGYVYLIAGSGPPTGTYSKVSEVLVSTSVGWVQIASNTAASATAWGVVFAEPNDKIISAGGARAGAVYGNTEAWEYDPATNAWTRIGNMFSAHGYQHVNTFGPQPILNDGRFVSAGGFDAAGTPVTAVDIYSNMLSVQNLFVSSSIYVSSGTYLTGLINKYNNRLTAAYGVPAIFASNRLTGQTAAAASVVALTVGGSDSSFEISANVNVTASTTHSITVTVAYTDEGNTGRTLTLSFSQLAGTIINAITNVTGAGPYEGVVTRIRAKAGTTITVATAGTFTSVTYNVEADITEKS